MYMGESQNLSVFVCGGVSYSQVLPCHMVLSYTQVSMVRETRALVRRRYCSNSCASEVLPAMGGDRTSSTRTRRRCSTSL